VIDRFQRRRIGAGLRRHLATIVRAAGLRKPTAEVLAENIPMLKVFERTKEAACVQVAPHEAGVVHIVLKLR
jgi:hypothetical protein